MFNAKQKQALAKAGISMDRIAKAEKALLPAPKKLKTSTIRRIEELLAEDGVAHVTRKRVFSAAGWKQKTEGGADHLKVHRFEKKRQAELAARPKTPAEISASLKS